MSDDLVKRWDEYVDSMGSVMGEVEHMAQQMRDRIEELEVKLQDAEQRGYANAMEAERTLHENRIEELEAKLAKAVRLMELSVELANWNTTLLEDVIDFITELKGQDDE